MSPATPPIDGAADAASDEALLRLARQAVQGLPDAPLAWQHSARALWAQRPQPLAGRLQAALVRVAAVLRFDSAAQAPQALGLRGAEAAAAGAGRQLLFAAEGCDLDLRLHPGTPAGCWRLSGQVLGPEDGGQLCLQDAQGAERALPIDAMGEFHLDGLPAGTWRLSLALPGRVLELPPLELPAAGAAPEPGPR